MMLLFRVTAPFFCAGVLVNAKGFVKESAPILNWARGKRFGYCHRYWESKGYRVELVPCDTTSAAVTKNAKPGVSPKFTPTNGNVPAAAGAVEEPSSAWTGPTCAATPRA